MTRIQTYQHGIFPRSEALVAATRDLERGRTTAEAVEERVRQDVRELLDVQREAGLDCFSDGLLRWQDIFRPLVEATDGLRPGPLVRWLDNNAFFRAPQVDGPLAPAPALPPAFADLDLVPQPRVVTLPSPYLFSRVAQTEGDRNRLMHEFAVSVLRPLAQALVAEHAYHVVHLQEPWLACFGIEAGDWRALERALDAFRDGLPATVVLHLPFGDAAPWADRLRELPVDAVGVDFVETDLAALGRGWRVGVLAGCLDGRRSLVEPVEPTTEFVEQVMETLDPPALYLSSATDLDLLPRDLAIEKIRTLGECARGLQEVVRA